MKSKCQLKATLTVFPGNLLERAFEAASLNLKDKSTNAVFTFSLQHDLSNYGFEVFSVPATIDVSNRPLGSSLQE